MSIHRLKSEIKNNHSGILPVIMCIKILSKKLISWDSVHTCPAHGMCNSCSSEIVRVDSMVHLEVTV